VKAGLSVVTIFAHVTRAAAAWMNYDFHLDVKERLGSREEVYHFLQLYLPGDISSDLLLKSKTD